MTPLASVPVLGDCSGGDAGVQQEVRMNDKLPFMVCWEPDCLSVNATLRTAKDADSLIAVLELLAPTIPTVPLSDWDAGQDVEAALGAAP